MPRRKVVFVTGGTGKLGSKFVKYLLEQGFTVIFTSRSEDKIGLIYEQFGSYHKQNKLYGILVNLEKEDSARHIIDFLNEKKLWPECIINNARNKDYLKVNRHFMPGRNEWMGEFLMDVVVPYELTMSLVNHKKSKVNNVINIASIYGVVPPNPSLYDDQRKASPVQYGVAKAGLIQLTKELAIRLADKGIRVNSVSYGGIEGGVSEEFKKRYSKLCPAGRMLRFEDAVGALHFLASDVSSGMTGHNLVVDGGWTIW